MDPISTDVAVAGGGLAGCIAAIAARRTRPDTKVLLVERYGFLGGMATAGYVFPFMRYHALMPDHSRKRLVGGIFKELTDRLLERGYAEANALDGDLVSRFDPAMLKCVLDAMVLEAGVDILFHGIVNRVETAKSGVGRSEVAKITAQTKAGSIDIIPKAVIDATGDADIVYHAGGPVVMGREEDGLVQPATLNFRIGNIDPEHSAPAFSGFYRKEIMDAMAIEKQRGNALTPRDDCLMFTAGQNQFHFNQTRVAGFDFTDPLQRTAAEIEGRKQAERFIRFLKEKIEGYENATVVGLGTELGLRETRRIVGEHVLTENELIDCTGHDDRVALGNYSIDIHDPKGTATTHIRHVPEGKWYSIPYGCLVPMEIDNVIVAGRPISTTHVAHSATRVMPTCSAIGHAAGVAAGMLASSPATKAFRDVDVKAIQATLRAQGAVLE